MQKKITDYISVDGYHYYGDVLPIGLEDAHDRLLEGFLDHAARINLGAVDPSAMRLIYDALKNDVPELFFVDNLKFSYTPSSTTVFPRYRLDRETTVDALRTIQERTRPVLDRMAAMPDAQKVKEAHDFLAGTVTYRNTRDAYDHEIVGPLMRGSGVCDGITRSFKYLADRAGLETAIVSGMATSAMMGAGRHAWNIVFVDSLAYNIDVTFDLGIATGGNPRYDYYLLSDAQMRVNHTPLDDARPRCTNDFEYYKSIGCYAEDEKALRDIMERRLRRDGSALVVKLSDRFHDGAPMTEKEIMDVIQGNLPAIPDISRFLVAYNDARRIVGITVE